MKRLLLMALVLLLGSGSLAQAQEALRKEGRDTDEDGAMDEWWYYGSFTPVPDEDPELTKKKALVRIERDRDADGKPEVWIYFDAGTHMRSEVDRDADGSPDLVRFMQGGRPEREQADLNFDGTLDAWVYYKEGVKDLMIMDKNFDGRPDAWFYYGQGGWKLASGKLDEDFDGSIDRVFGPAPEEETRKPW